MKARAAVVRRRATAGRLAATAIAAALTATGLMLGNATVAAAVAGPQASAARVGSAPAAQTLQLVLPLVANEAGLRSFAEAVTTPGSPRYGQYESIAWLSRRYGASAQTRARVVRFLRSAGATGVRIDATGLFVDARLRTGRASRLFSASLASFRSARSTATYTAPAAAVTVPAGLRGLVTGVVGLDTKPIATAPAILHAPRITRSVARNAAQPPSGYACTPSACPGVQQGCARGKAAGGFTPNQYLTAYGYNALHGAGDTGQGERVALIEIDGFRKSDISTFGSCFGLRVPPINQFGVDVRRALAPGGEATLDLEVLDAVAPGLKAIDVYESNAQAQDVLLALTAPLQNSGFKPQVMSASLGLCEAQTLAAVGKSGLAATEGALEEAAASGISFLAASGDDGSADCVNSSSSNSLPEAALAVNYPASSPWATGVGGTNIVLNAANAITSQVVWNDTNVIPGAAGGGGTSGLFTRPSYQTGTVGLNHREVPDVSAVADVAPGYDVYCTASDCVNSSIPPWQPVGGTSAATPLLAGGFAIIDQLLRKQKLQSLGLANPLLYKIGRNPQQAPSVFSDVTTGSNDVGPYIQPSGQPLGCCSAGPGFDEASGLGSLNLSQFSVVALASQPKIVDVSLALPGGQRPVAKHHLLARVSCTGACLLGAFAKITIGRAKAFIVVSSLHRLAARGSETIKIGYSKSQLSKLRAAIASRTRITATVTGAIVDAGGNIERETPSKKLRITS